MIRDWPGQWQVEARAQKPVAASPKQPLHRPIAISSNLILLDVHIGLKISRFSKESFVNFFHFLWNAVSIPGCQFWA